MDYTTPPAEPGISATTNGTIPTATCRSAGQTRETAPGGKRRLDYLERFDKFMADEQGRLDKARVDEHERILQHQREIADKNKDRDRKRHLIEKIPKLEASEQLVVFLLGLKPP